MMLNQQSEKSKAVVSRTHNVLIIRENQLAAIHWGVGRKEVCAYDLGDSLRCFLGLPFPIYLRSGKSWKQNKGEKTLRPQILKK
jgi:hypothetical protein